MANPKGAGNEVGQTPSRGWSCVWHSRASPRGVVSAAAHLKDLQAAGERSSGCKRSSE